MLSRDKRELDERRKMVEEELERQAEGRCGRWTVILIFVVCVIVLVVGMQMLLRM